MPPPGPPQDLPQGHPGSRPQDPEELLKAPLGAPKENLGAP